MVNMNFETFWNNSRREYLAHIFSNLGVIFCGALGTTEIFKLSWKVMLKWQNKCMEINDENPYMVREISVLILVVFRKPFIQHKLYYGDTRINTIYFFYTCIKLETHHLQFHFTLFHRLPSFPFLFDTKRCHRFHIHDV